MAKSTGGFTHWLKSLPNYGGKLKFEECELLLDYTHEYRLENETSFYHQQTYPIRLYVKWNQTEIDAELPDEDMTGMVIDVNKNTLFFHCNDKIYSVIFVPPRDIRVTLLRNIREYEQQRCASVTRRILCTSTKLSDTYFYNLWESPDEEGVKFDVPTKKRGNLEFLGIHRGKIILYDTSTIFYKVVRLVDNALAIKFFATGHFSSFFQESSPYLYILLYNSPYPEFVTINTDTLEMLPLMRPKLKLAGNINYQITSVIHDEMRLDQDCYNDGLLYSRTTFRAELPTRYFQWGFRNSFTALTSSSNGADSDLGVHEAQRPLTLDLEDCVDDTLRFTVKEALPTESTTIYQTEDGTIFYLDFTIPKLFVKLQSGKQIDKLLFGEISRVCAHGKALYYISEAVNIKMIYKAEFTPPETINVTYVRDIEENEGIFDEGLCCSHIDGAQFFYRICDNPKTDGVLLTDLTNRLYADDLWIMGMHRGILILASRIGSRGRKLSENSIIIKLPIDCVPEDFNFFSHNSSSFAYGVYHKYLIAIHTEKLELLPVIEFDTELVSFAGVYNGVATAIRTDAGRKFLVTAQLPEIYFEQMNSCKAPEAKEEAISSQFSTDDGTADLNEQFEQMNSCNANIEKEGSSSHLVAGTAELNEELPPAADSIYESEFLKRFKPVRIIGCGGYGQVFESERTIANVIKRNFTIKRIPIPKSRQRRKRDLVSEALKEVEALISFDHPGIVRFYDAWKEEPPEGFQKLCDDNLLNHLKSKNPNLTFKPFNYEDDCSFLYIQMEICDYSLFDWLRLNTQRDQMRVKSWFKQIVAAVGYIHEQEKIHRDLKPSNILFAGEDRLKICDLGIVADRE